MKSIKIRRMPKYIIEKIHKEDKVIYPAPDGHIRFYAYLAIWNKELVKVTVAVKHRYKNWYCKQVAVHGLHWEKCYVKDMEYCGYIGQGYRVGWYEQGLQRCRNWLENENWGLAKDKYYDPFAPIINKEVISNLPEFKYSAYTLYEQHIKLEIESSNAPTKQKISSFVEEFLKEDLNSKDYQKQVIKNLANSVYVYDDRTVIYFNFDNNEKPFISKAETDSAIKEMQKPDTSKGSDSTHLAEGLQPKSNKLMLYLLIQI